MKTCLFTVVLLFVHGLYSVCFGQQPGEKVYDYLVELPVKLDTSANNRLIVLLDTNGVRVATTQRDFEQHLNSWLSYNSRIAEDRLLMEKVLADTLHNRVIDASAIAAHYAIEKRLAYRISALIDDHLCTVTNTLTRTNYPEIRVQRYVGNSGGKRYFSEAAMFLTVMEWIR